VSTNCSVSNTSISNAKTPMKSCSNTSMSNTNSNVNKSKTPSGQTYKTPKGI
jgi:hypothetical protein